jgi:hypothetical protein
MNNHRCRAWSGTVFGENAPRDVVPTNPGLPMLESTVSGIWS